MPGLKRFEWKQRLRPVLRLVALVLVLEGGVRVAEAYTASPLPRILSYFSTSDTTVVRLGDANKPVRHVKLRHGDYDPYAGNRARQEREETADAPPEDAGALANLAAVDTLPPPNLPRSERRCLAEAVYYEGRGETMEGQIAVAQVVLNRVRSGKWPDTICGVVREGREGRGESCQFPAVCRAGERPPETDVAWQRAALLADDAAAGRAWLNELTEATHYHNASAKPPWRLSMQLIRKIGWRMFYADPKASARLVSLKPGEAPVAIAPDRVASEDARETGTAAEAKRLQRELQRARLASVEARQPKTTVTKSVATEIFSRMER
jgi:spore germination cell wall hydrolase CwlJ-like protein